MQLLDFRGADHELGVTERRVLERLLIRGARGRHGE
jgi:hypothetical protein